MPIPLSVERLKKRFPIATVALIGLNVGVFLITFFAAWVDVGFWQRWGFVPDKDGLISLKMLFSVFLHAGFFHLVLNMWFLFIFGAGVEDACGKVRFLLIYIISGIVGQVFGGMLSVTSTPVVGSGTAVSGIIGAYLILYPRYRASVFVFAFWMMRHAEVPAWTVAGLWGIVQTIYASVLKGGAVEMSYPALLFGFVTGILLLLGAKTFFVLERIEKRSKDDVSWLLKPTKARLRRGRKKGSFVKVGREELEAAKEMVEGRDRLQNPAEKLRKLLTMSAGGAALQVWRSMTDKERCEVAPSTLKMLVRSAIDRGELRDALRCAKTLVNVTQDGVEKAEAFYLLGQVYERVCDYGAAIKEYERAEAGGEERAGAALERLRRKMAPCFLSPFREGSKYAVVRADTHSTGAHTLVEVVAEITGETKGDVARRIHVCGGTYAVGLDGEKARELANELSRLGVPTLVVNVEDVPPPPPPVSVAAAAFRPDGLLWTVNLERDPTLVPWDRIVAINAGVIERKTSPKPKVITTVRGEVRREVKPMRQAHMFALVDILLVKPYERLRIDEKRFSYALMEAKHAVSGWNFSLFLRRGIELAPETTVVTEGARIVARMEQLPIERALILTERVLDLQGFWVAVMAYARRTTATS